MRKMISSLGRRTKFFYTGQVKKMMTQQDTPEDGTIISGLPALFRKSKHKEERKPLSLPAVRQVYYSHNDSGGAWGNQIPQLDSDSNPTVYASLLRQCGCTKDLAMVKLAHAIIIKKGYEQHIFLGNLLIQMYDKCELLDHAWAVFANMNSRNVFSWHIMIGGFVHHGQNEFALLLFQQMQLEGMGPNQVTFVSILSACASPRFLAAGKQVHAQIVGTIYESDVTVGNALISMYGKCGSVVNAQQTFLKLPERNVISWSTMASVYSQYEKGNEAIHLLNQMKVDGMIPNEVTFISILSGCTSNLSLAEGKQIHIHIMTHGFDSDVAVGTAIVNMYCKCESLEDALRIFNDIPDRNVFSYNTLIAACNQQGLAKDAFLLFQEMLLEGVAQNESTLVSVLSACASDANLCEGTKIHMSIVGTGFETSVRVGNALINMYSKCGSLEAAQKIFEVLPGRSVLSYNCIISAFVQYGQGKVALHLVQQMYLESLMPDKVTVFTILSACGEVGFIDEGSLLLCYMIQDSEILSTVECYHNITKLMARVVELEKFGHVIDSISIHKKVFFMKILLKDLFIKKSVFESLKGNALEGKAIDLLDISSTRMDIVTYSSLLRYCISAKALSDAKLVHTCIIHTGHERDRFLGNLLIQMYGSCGALQDAWAVFSNMSQCNVYTWNLMIGACIQSDQRKDAVQLFQQMALENVMVDKVTFVSILSACAYLGNLDVGRNMHRLILTFDCKQDVDVENALVNMYGKCASMDDAQNTFDKALDRNILSWNALIAVYAQHGQGKKALRFFHQMLVENVIADEITFISILSACTSRFEGKKMHAQLLTTDMLSDNVVGNALLNMYGKCSSTEDAMRMFDEMPHRNVGTWNAMIDAYVHHGHCKEAVQLFHFMQRSGSIPDKVTFVNMLSGCAREAAVSDGNWLHDLMLEYGFASGDVIEIGLINMYNKCGSLEDAQRIFERMFQQSLVSLNTMIAAYAQHGHSKAAFQLYQQMQWEGVIPNGATFLVILSACNHAGLVDEGWQYFGLMSQHHGIIPTMEHYDCLIDLLGRAGLLDDGEELLKTMPFTPTITSWMMLLSNSKTHLDVERGKRAADGILKLDPDNLTTNIILSNIYAAAGRWDDAANLGRMKDRMMS